MLVEPDVMMIALSPTALGDGNYPGGFGPLQMFGEESQFHVFALTKLFQDPFQKQGAFEPPVAEQLGVVGGYQDTFLPGFLVVSGKDFRDSGGKMVGILRGSLQGRLMARSDFTDVTAQ